MAPISVPIASRLPSSLRIAPTNAAVTRVLSRLSRPALLSLALDWLDEGNQSLTAPYLRRSDNDDDDDDDDDDNDFYPPAASLEALQEHYANLQTRKGSKREVLDRILEGDWRHGLSLYQLAMADLQHLYDHPTSQKWTAFQIVPLTAKAEGDATDGDGDGDGDSPAAAVVDKASLVVPRFHPSSFLRNLQAQILPDIKVHYNFDRHKHLPLLLLRIFILDSPYNTSMAAAPVPSAGTDSTGPARPASFESSRTVYIAFPDGSPFVYLSSAQSSSAGERAPGAVVGVNGGAASLRSLVVEAIPKALSQPRERYALKPTNLATRNLAELLQRRGAGRTNTAGGGWGIYADEKTTIESPLSTALPDSVASRLEGKKKKKEGKRGRGATGTGKRPLSPGTQRDQQQAKRRKQVAAARFGLSAKMGDGCGVERVDIVMQDPFPGGRRFDRKERNETEREPMAVDSEPSQAPPPAADRRRSKAGRRSQIDAALARDEEQSEEEEAKERDEARRTAGEEQDEEGGGEGESSESTWRPRVAFTFHGPHVFAGIRQLVEAGVIDGEKMPGWMTGEEGVTVGAVRHGRIRGHRGSGMP